MSSNPPVPSSRLTIQEYTRVWWAIIWRNSLFGFVAGTLLGGVAGLILSTFGYGHLGAPVGAFMGALGNIVISFFVIKHVLAKRFAGFEIVVLRSEDNVRHPSLSDSPSAPDAATP
ncbi:MAG: hypothetical protein B7Z44_01630 [Caulobacter sp. 12-67-6]|nr:MAG: hypothetical protein B7Z44_01630 [Caulobacter sp. 12-67-6]OYX67936.1 MAG: hypothetical protein B7Y81_18160 [Caulobacter sp. 32-67-35]OYX96192.1 MAG: hypothetical protein B7Y78_03975 [Caulobacter sp. 35-67-4]OZA70839.1 MAG: hypothetical protein B7X77_13270 [Caulobacter sp. 39-67-4]HQR90024.1 hypothetical protein [Caulobacter sp.]